MQETFETNDVTAEAYSGSSMSVAPIVNLNAKAESGSSITYTKVPKTTLSKEENSGGSVSQQ
ncbi:hypothetical protein [Flavobacterium sp. 3HN19-14]|uniref:hypothetical protein n=1 Tax=Flavobacterium sp. 3HN19-14 TaxID=3448133 RepID=UPI003EE126FC